MNQGHISLQFYNPVIQALQERGGIGKSSEVIKDIQKKIQLSEPETDKRNIIAWARAYLVKANYLKSNSPRGVWELTEKGMNAGILSEEEVKNIFKSVQHSYHLARKNDDTDDTEEINEGLEDPDHTLEISIDIENDILHSDDSDEIEDNKVIETDEDTIEEDLKDSLFSFDLSKSMIDFREDPHTVYELVVRKFERKQINIDPDFQRNFVWKTDKMSFFIESILLNFPLPPLYLNETIDGNFIVIDGRQRITTLRKFLKDEFPLEGLKALPDINGKKFSELTSVQQRKIEDRKLNLLVIKPSVPIEVVYDIFYRINTGGTQLQRQEIRNCIFLGKSTELLKELSAENYFKKAIDWGISSKRMKDREAILRYLAFKIQGYESYNGDMSDFLENAMKKINKMTAEQIIELKKDFQRVMEKTTEFFQERNFRFPIQSKDKTNRGRINIAMLESVAYFFSNTPDEYLSRNEGEIKSNFLKLLKDSQYIDAVRFSTGDKRRVIDRFQIAERILMTLRTRRSMSGGDRTAGGGNRGR